MDPLTQGVLGAAAAQALFSKQLGARAWLLGAVGGVLPDADVFIRSDMDPLLAIEYHRQFTHALAFIPVGGAMASVPWLIREKYRQQWKTVLGATTAGYATHGLLRGVGVCASARAATHSAADATTTARVRAARRTGRTG